jgi:hypothetical protein
MRLFSVVIFPLLILAVQAQAPFPIQPSVLYTDSLPPGEGHLFAINITRPVRQVIISVETEHESSLAPNIFVGFRYEPTSTQYDAQSQAVASGNYLNMLLIDYVQWEGEWVILLEAQSAAPDAVPFSLWVYAYECLNNCSGKGRCEPQSGVCVCDGERTGADCSIEPEVSALPATLTGDVGPDGDWDVYRLEVPPHYGASMRTLCVPLRVL